MELLFGGGQQASVYPSDDSMPYAVCVKLRLVCHEDASFVFRYLIRIYDTVKWNLASLLCQVCIFEQFYGVVGKIRFWGGQCHAVVQHDHLFVFESGNNVGKAAPGQQQVVLVDPSAVFCLFPFFQFPVFQNGWVVLNDSEPVSFSLDDEKCVHVFHRLHLVLSARAQIGRSCFIGKDNP